MNEKKKTQRNHEIKSNLFGIKRIQWSLSGKIKEEMRIFASSIWLTWVAEL